MKKSLEKGHDQALREFKGDAQEIEEMQLPFAASSVLYLFALLVVSAITWASVSKVDKIVVTKGKLITTGQEINVQPLNDSIVRSVNVQVGQVVKKDQKLIILDPTFAQSDEGQIKVRISSLNAQIKRLECELGGKPFKAPSDTTPEAALLQEKIYQDRKSEYQSRIVGFDEATGQGFQQMTSAANQLVEVKKQIVSAEDVMRMREETFKSGYDTKLNYIDAQTKLSSLKAQAESLSREELEKRHALSKNQADKAAFLSSWKSDTAKELASAIKERDTLQEQVSKAARLSELVELTAPVDAVVLQLGKAASVGSVAKNGEALLTMVPLNSPLEAEVNIDPSDIGYVRTGDECKVKLDTFPYQKHGTLDGRLRTISEDTIAIQTQTGSALTYRGRIELLSTVLEHVPSDNRLLPGMSLTAEVKVGERRVISYFLYPLIQMYDGSIREP